MSTKLKVTIVASSLAILLFTLWHFRQRQRLHETEPIANSRVQRSAVAHPPGIRRGAECRGRHRWRAAWIARVARRQLQLSVGRRVQALQSGDEERRQGHIGATVSKRLATRTWSRDSGVPRKRPGSTTPTSSNRSRARARMTCRWLRFTAVDGEVGSTITVAVCGRARRAAEDCHHARPSHDSSGERQDARDNVGYIQVDAFPEGESQKSPARFATSRNRERKDRARSA